VKAKAQLNPECHVRSLGNQKLVVFCQIESSHFGYKSWGKPTWFPSWSFIL